MPVSTGRESPHPCQEEWRIFWVLLFLVKKLEGTGRKEPGIGTGWGEGEK